MHKLETARNSQHNCKLNYWQTERAIHSKSKGKDKHKVDTENKESQHEDKSVPKAKNPTDTLKTTFKYWKKESASIFGVWLLTACPLPYCPTFGQTDKEAQVLPDLAVARVQTTRAPHCVGQSSSWPQSPTTMTPQASCPSLLSQANLEPAWKPDQLFPESLIMWVINLSHFLSACTYHHQSQHETTFGVGSPSYLCGMITTGIY